MKLLLIDGCLRERDGLHDALDAAAEELRRAGLEAEVFRPIRTKELMCSGCGACKGAGMCVYDPRGQDFVRAAASCDGFLFAAPAGLFGLDVDMKNFLERVGSLAKRRESDPLAGKRAAACLIGRRSARAPAQLRELLCALGLRLPNGEPPTLRAGDPQTADTLCDLAQTLIR